ncbi:hypothetical protein ABFS83_08G092400 [Erythranthe nasuta]
MELMSSAIYGIIAFTFLLCCYLLRSSSGGPKNAPPAAGGARPFIGHLHLMGGGGGSLPHFNLSALADKYGPIFTIRLGIRRAVIVSSAQLAKELYTACDVAISSRPNLKSAIYLSYDFAMFGFTPYGAYWREIRKLTAMELLSSRRIELLKEVRGSEIDKSINELYKQTTSTEKRVVVEMKEWFGNLNLNVVLMMVAGKRYSGGGDDVEETRRWRAVMRDFFHFITMVVPADAMPYLGWLDLGGHEKKMRETAKELDRTIGGWLAEHREKKNSGDDESKPQDFMDVMLSVVKSANFQGEYDADTIIKATCGTMIIGGSDPTTVMLVWALSLLLNNRRALKKVQEELDEQVGRERRVKESDINNLVYLQAVAKETLRLYPASPLGGVREFGEDTSVGGYNVPKGTWLMINLWKMQRDPLVWGDDAAKFRPERFLETHKIWDMRGKDFEFIPFGAGRRICPGTNFGLHMLHLVLANVLQAFDVTTVSDQAVDMTESAGLTNLKATPLDVVVAPRLPSYLY